MDKADELGKLYQKIFKCSKCRPSVYASRERRQVLENTLDSEIVFMAQAPGVCGVRISGVHWNREDGTLTSGGSFLDKHLAVIGHSVNINNKAIPRAYTTNVLHCWTGRDKGGNRDRLPTGDELENCKNYWQEELKIIKPTIMVLLGAPAIECFSQVISGEKWKLAEMLKCQGKQITLADMKFSLFFSTASHVSL